MFTRISHRIALQFTAFVFVLLIVNGAVFLAVDLGNARRQSGRRMEGVARTIAQQMALPEGERPLLPPPPLMGGMRVPPGMARERIRIVDADGQTIVAGSIFTGIPFSAAERIQRFTVDEEPYVLFTLPIMQEGKMVGYVQAAGPDQFPVGALPMRILLYLLVSIVITVLTYGAGLFFARRSLAPAQQMLERLEQFTQDASHELRTPLAALNSSLDLALRSGRHEEGIRSAKEDVHSLTGLVERLLELARLNDFTVARESLDLSVLSHAVMERQQPFARERKVTLLDEIADSVRREGDALLLKQVIENLVHNAIKFSKPAGGTVTVRLMQDRLEVRDDGVGIGVADLPHVFDRFYQADTSRSRGGFGLGLALTRRIVELHGWTIDVESEEGKGTTFTVRFGGHG